MERGGEGERGRGGEEREGVRGESRKGVRGRADKMSAPSISNCQLKYCYEFPT